MDKLSINYQQKFKGRLIYDESVFDNIDSSVKLHDETKNNPLSSAASCLNVLGSLAKNPEELKRFLNMFNLNIGSVIKFPSGANIGDLIYNDKGYVVFEWIGPQKSPINEVGGGRGHNRTSVDAFIIAEIKGIITQIFIEWKFTEGKSRPIALKKFSGMAGLERLRRYSEILVPLRNIDDFPFNFIKEGGLGLYDFSADHLFQLLRMTLLAKTTIPIQIGKLNIEDYKIVHLSHSQNDEINVMHDKYLACSPGLKDYSGMTFHEVWRDILTNREKENFTGGYWDTALGSIENDMLREYLSERYQ